MPTERRAGGLVCSVRCTRRKDHTVTETSTPKYTRTDARRIARAEAELVKLKAELAAKLRELEALQKDTTP